MARSVPISIRLTSGFVSISGPFWTRARVTIGVAAEAARRVEVAAPYIGARSRDVTAHLRQLAMSVLSDRRMPEGVKTIIGKVRSWTQSGAIRRTCDRDLFVHEYGR